MSTCRGGQSHKVAEELADFLVTRGGSITGPNWDLIKRTGLSYSQFTRARIHLMDAEDASGEPCLGFRVNYKWSTTDAIMSLIDPVDTFNNLKDVAHNMARGARQQYIGQLTVQHRLSNQYATMAQAWFNTCRQCKGGGILHCRLGRALEQAAEEWVRLGHITNTTMGRVNAQQAAHGVKVVTW